MASPGSNFPVLGGNSGSGGIGGGGGGSSASNSSTPESSVKSGNRYSLKSLHSSHGSFTLQDSPHHSQQQQQTYANRAATAIRASGFARFGKALYGSRESRDNASPSGVASSGGTGPSSTRESSDHEQQQQQNQQQQQQQQQKSYGGGHLSYRARSAINAMGHSNDKQLAAIAGKEFFKILQVKPDGIGVVKDVRESRGVRDFDKMFAITALKWGHQQYSNNIALATSGGCIFIYDVGSASTPARLVKDLGDSQRAVNSVNFSPSSGHTIISGYSDGICKMWDIRSNNKRPLAVLNRLSDCAREVQFSPSSPNKVAVIYDSGVIQKWDIRNPKVVEKRVNAHLGVGLCLDWHPDADYLVSGGRDQQIQVWNMASDSRSPEIVIHTRSAVARVRWQIDSKTSNSINGKTPPLIASCGRSKGDSPMYIWNPHRPYAPVHAIEEHDDFISDLYWKSDNTLWTASKDGLFSQHCLDDEPFTVDNLRPQALAWMSTNDFTFVAQETGHDSLGATVSSQTGPGSLFVPDEEVFADDNTTNTNTVTNAKRSGSGAMRRSGSTSQHRVNSTSSRSIRDFDFFNQAICSSDFIAVDGPAFRTCAFNYQISPHATDKSLSDLCLMNSKVASQAHLPRTAHVWTILASSVEWEQNRFEEYRAKKGPLTDVSTAQLNRAQSSAAVDKMANQSPRAPKAVPSKIAQSLKSLAGGNPNQLQSPNLAAVEHPHFKDPLSRIVSAEQENAACSSTDMTRSPSPSDSSNPVIAESPRGGTKTADSALSTSALQSVAQPLEIKKINDQGTTVDLTGTSLGTTASSGDGIYGSLDDNRRQSMAKGAISTSIGTGEGAGASASLTQSGINFTRITRAQRHSSTMDSAFDSVHSRGSERDDESSVGTRASWGVTGDPDSVSSSHKDGELADLIRMTRIDDGDYGGAATEEQKALNAEKELFAEFLSTLHHPWKMENLLREAAQYALDQGDIQMCATLAMLFYDRYPRAFGSVTVVEEWVHMYVEILRRCQEFPAMAAVIKQSTFESIRSMGLTETSVDLQCHRCMAPLRDVNTAGKIGVDVAFWYCARCSKVLDGCSLCREPIKGLATGLLGCGHMFHGPCMDSWILDDGMLECPSGCGAVIVK